VKIIRQLVSFVLGVTVGVCLYSLLKLRPLSPARFGNASAPAGAKYKSLRAPWVQRSWARQVCAPVRVHSVKHRHAMTREVAGRQVHLQPKPEPVRVPQPAAAREVAVVKVPPAPPAPKTFKTIGYVEKAGGQLEAIILQENEIQVVHLGDLIAERYRVTKVSPDSVAAIDETLVESPMAKPDGAGSKELTAGVEQGPSTPLGAVAAGRQEALMVAAGADRPPNLHGAAPVSALPAVDAQVQSTNPPGAVTEGRSGPPQDAEQVANSLGYVQKADGKVEAVVADGDSVRLVPDNPAVTMAQSAPHVSQEGTTPAHDSTRLAAAVSASSSAITDSSVDMSGMAAFLPASVTPLAAYEVPAPASSSADISAPSRPRMDLDGETAATLIEPSAPAASNFGETPGGLTPSSTKLTVTIKPLGFVVKADGELAAILAQDDEIYVVRQGDRFAGRYRAVSVSADAVEAVQDPQRHAQPLPSIAPTTSPDLLSASNQQRPPQFSAGICSSCKSSELAEESAKVLDDPPAESESPPPRKGKDEQARSALPKGTRQRASPTLKETPASPGPATFVFQTLGYVETQNGEMQAIVADGSQVYLVKQGETFADQYRATSVDPILVLAVRVSPGQDVGNFLSAQTESGGKPASKRLYGYLHFPLSGLENAQALHEMGASGSPALTDLGVNLLGSSLTGFDLQANFFTAGNPNGGF
jgi:hypothetical protein